MWHAGRTKPRGQGSRASKDKSGEAVEEDQEEEGEEEEGEEEDGDEDALDELMAGSDEEEAGDGAGEAGEEEGEEELQLRRMLSRTAKAAGRPKPQGAPFMYSDFFGQQLPQAPTAAPNKRAVGSLGQLLAGSGAEGSAGEEEQSEEEEEEDGEEAEEEDEQQRRGANGSTAGRKALGIAKAVPGARGKPEQLSTHEQRLLRMQERIGELEAAALGEKQWTLLGEVDAQRRPLNSVLEVDLDFDTTAVRPAPEPSQEAMASLEDLIKQRIADHKFDDVVRVLPLGPEPQRKELLLQDTKAAKGLGEEYEEAYVKAAGGTTQVQDAEDKLRQAARLLFQELVAKLDALSHFHYTPKPVVEDLSVRTDVAAVRMEEAAPLAVSTASMQVPAEVYKPTEGGAPKAEAELTNMVFHRVSCAYWRVSDKRRREDRKRRRAAHKRAGKSAALQQQSEKRAKALASGMALPAPDNGLPVAGRKSAALAAATGGKKGAKRAAKEAAAAAGVGATKHARTEFGKSSKVFARIQEQQDQAKAAGRQKSLPALFALVKAQTTDMKDIKDMCRSLMRRLGSSVREQNEACHPPQEATSSPLSLSSCLTPEFCTDDRACPTPPPSPFRLFKTSTNCAGATRAVHATPSHSHCPSTQPASPQGQAVTASVPACPSSLHPAQQPQSQQQQQAVASAGGGPLSEYPSTTLAVSHQCPAALRRNSWCVSDFELRALMYNGNISMVYHAVDRRSGVTVALKLYKRAKLTAIERHQVAREIKLHINLCHDSIIAMYAAWKDRNYVYMALEWAPGGDVYGYLRANRGRLSEEVAVPLILEPFLSGLRLIHEQGLIHRDIKPENILLNHSFQIKIADFGLSIDSTNEVANTRLGTIDYLAPEILDCPVKQNPNDNKENPNIGYTNKVDCWSVGVLAYELLAGQPPFAAPSPQETLRRIRTKEVEYPPWFSHEALDFLRGVLVRDPRCRPTISQMLMHPWVRRWSNRYRAPGTDRARRSSLPVSMLIMQPPQPAVAPPAVAHAAPADSSSVAQPGSDSNSESGSVTATVLLAVQQPATPHVAYLAKSAACVQVMGSAKMQAGSAFHPSPHGNYTEQSHCLPLPEAAALAAAAAAAAQASYLASRTQKFLSLQSTQATGPGCAAGAAMAGGPAAGCGAGCPAALAAALPIPHLAAS
ncbi:hypothetical protein QJQ45_014333 [Haematococcus lacustris]|nr:hypothetical protein QJQ45_014333 [Haematococcus lacustris]